jgi:hypothetical protein
LHERKVKRKRLGEESKGRLHSQTINDTASFKFFLCLQARDRRDLSPEALAKGEAAGLISCCPPWGRGKEGAAFKDAAGPEPEHELRTAGPDPARNADSIDNEFIPG